jgi:hypothetical protein
LFCIPSSDSIGALIEEGASYKIYSALKDGKRYAIERVCYETRREVELVDSRERTFNLLKGSYPYLMSIEDSFKDVFFNFFFLSIFVKAAL